MHHMVVSACSIGRLLASLATLICTDYS